MRMLDLFCGRCGWAKAFAAKGWTCTCVDLVEPPELPENCFFYRLDVLLMTNLVNFCNPDFICASSPCEQFSVHGMKHFHPNPPYPELGIKLFNHTRQLCEASGVPYVMENVRAAQQFVGRAVHHCGPFYLWGNGVPPLLSQGIKKGLSFKRRDGTFGGPNVEVCELMYGDKTIRASMAATIPPELANCVADYAERLLEMKTLVSTTADRGTQFR